MSQLHLKSYDQIQREAVLVQCSQCPAWYYATHPKTPELCHLCADKAWQAALAGQRGSR